MTTTEHVQRVLDEKRPQFADDASFLQLQDFYRRMSEQGAVVKRGYTLPQLDTIGRELYHAFATGKGSSPRQT